MSSNDERVHHPIFARLYARLSAAAERQGQAEHRDRALTELQGKVIELGAGNGLNFPHYPWAVSEVIAVEPESYLRKQAQRAAASAPVPIRVIDGHANAVPAEDRSFDAAVASLVLCTVPDPEAALREIDRVLAPGGRFLFLEHVRSPDPKLASWQDRLHGPWYLFGDGCHCNRDTLATIERSPLEVERADRGEIPKSAPITKPMLRGAARGVPTSRA